MQKKIVIIGGGLVGTLLSIYLAKRGHIVSIYERRADMRNEEVAAGRSINLALSDRGIKALHEVGIDAEILGMSIPMYGRSIHNTNGTHAYQPYGKEGQCIYAVSRGGLNKKLLALAEAHSVEIFFNQKCEHIDWKTNVITFENVLSAKQSVVNAEVIFGADGAYAASRMQHMVQHQAFNYDQFYIDCVYKEIAIPAGNDGAFLLDKHALHIWPRNDFMLIALPNPGGSFTGTLFFPKQGDTAFQSLNTLGEAQRFFEENFADVVKLVPDAAQQFIQNPTATLVTIKCFPWVRGGHFALIGDAAHAIVPFFGQGMNCGFEDCSVLNALMDKYNGDDWTTLLEDFQRQRKPDADAIADLAINNFTEMRSRVADPKFLLQKKIEAYLHEKYPDKWIPAYSQVTFSPQIRYSEALSRGQKQEAIMQQIMKLDGIDANWQTEEIEQIILSRL